MERLKTEDRVVGINQTKKAISEKNASLVYVASDANPAVVGPLQTLAQSVGVPVVVVDTMKKLGEACGIEVGASAAALIK